MIIYTLKEDGITKDEIQRNVDFAFLTEEEKDEKLKETIKEFFNKFADGLNEALTKDEDKGE